MTEEEIIRLFGLADKDNDDVTALPGACQGGQVLWATDAMSEGTHFRNDWSAPEAVARKLAAANISDFHASHAVPRAALLNLGLPSDIDSDWIRRFARALVHRLKYYGVVLQGGDTFRSRSLQLSLTVCGTSDRMVRRDSLKSGDRLYLRRLPGFSLLGYRLLAWVYDSHADYAFTASQCFPALYNLEDHGRRLAGLVEMICESHIEGEVILPGHFRAAEQAEPGFFAALAEMCSQPSGEALDPRLCRERRLLVRALAVHLQPRPERAVPAAASAGLDLSDGLLIDARRLARAAGLDVTLELDGLVAAWQKLFSSTSDEAAVDLLLGSGEEYSALFARRDEPLPEEASLIYCGRCSGAASGRPKISTFLRGAAITVQSPSFSHFEPGA